MAGTLPMSVTSKKDGYIYLYHFDSGRMYRKKMGYNEQDLEINQDVNVLVDQVELIPVE